MIVVAGSRQRTNKTKTIVCAICRKSFARRRSTARFCSPRCRQRAHRRTSPLPFDELDANGYSKRNAVNSNRGPCGSAERISKPLPALANTAAHQPTLGSHSFALTFAPYIVQDARWPNMWRVAFPDGSLSDMVNIARAKEALMRAQRSSRRSHR